MSSDDFFLNILNVIYPDGEAPCLTIISPHSLSIFFATVALGILCDKTEDGNKRSERYHNLARAALSFQSLSMDASCATIQAVFLITRLTQKIHSCVSEECWLLNGINNRLIHKVSWYLVLIVFFHSSCHCSLVCVSDSQLSAESHAIDIRSRHP